MRVSQRSQKTHAAQSKLELVIYQTAQELGLTNVEMLQSLASVQQTTFKYMLRVERHGNIDTPADVEKDTTR